jgi:hypothetical protein
VLVVAVLAACQPSGNRPPASAKPIHCTVIVDGPKRAESTDKISGRVRFRCGAPGAEVLTLKVRIEKSSGEKWATVGSNTITLKGKQTVAAELKYQARDAVAGCSAGTFRTVVDWSRKSRKDTDGDNLISGTVRDPCKPPIFG